MQMNNRRIRSGPIWLGEKPIDDAGGWLDERLAAFERETALQRPNLVARAFKLHAFGGVCAVAYRKGDQRGGKLTSQLGHDGLRREQSSRTPPRMGLVDRRVTAAAARRSAR